MKLISPSFKIIFPLSLLFLCLLSGSACSSENSPSVKTAREVVVINTFPHDNEAFTQGLAFNNGSLYESTGLHGKSSLRKVNLKTGEVEKIHKLSDHLFGEGITILDKKIYQLTWRSKTGIIYDLESFKILGFFDYPFEGWGITNDQKNLIISNGTPNIYFYNPESFKQIRSIKVTDMGEPVSLINELEYIDGKIYANIWRSNKIISIDPDTGKVLDWYDLSGLRKQAQGKDKMDVLNGIAFDSKSGRIFVTGKLWPKLFEINLN